MHRKPREISFNLIRIRLLLITSFAPCLIIIIIWDKIASVEITSIFQPRCLKQYLRYEIIQLGDRQARKENVKNVVFKIALAKTHVEHIMYVVLIAEVAVINRTRAEWLMPDNC